MNGSFGSEVSVILKVTFDLRQKWNVNKNILKSKIIVQIHKNKIARKKSRIMPTFYTYISRCFVASKVEKNQAISSQVFHGGGLGMIRRTWMTSFPSQIISGTKTRKKLAHKSSSKFFSRKRNFWESLGGQQNVIYSDL